MKALLAKYNALAARQRIGILIALVALVYLAFDASLLGPHTKRQKALRADLAKAEADRNALSAEMVVVKAQLDKDPHAKDRAQLDAYKKAMDEADAFLATVESDPRYVGNLLRQLLNSTPGVTLVSLKTLPATPVIEGNKAVPAKGGAAPEAARSVYKRGIEITVRGNYLAILPYLEKLQNMPTRVLWSDAELGVATYPDSTGRLVIYTLSTEAKGSLG